MGGSDKAGTPQCFTRLVEWNYYQSSSYYYKQDELSNERNKYRQIK